MISTGSELLKIDRLGTQSNTVRATGDVNLLRVDVTESEAGTAES